MLFFLGGRVCEVRWGGQDGLKRRVEVFVKIKRKIRGGGGVRTRGGVGGQDMGRGVVGVRVDVNGEVKFL